MQRAYDTNVMVAAGVERIVHTVAQVVSYRTALATAAPATMETPGQQVMDLMVMPAMVEDVVVAIQDGETTIHKMTMTTTGSVKTGNAVRTVILVTMNVAHSTAGVAKEMLIVAEDANPNLAGATEEIFP